MHRLLSDNAFSKLSWGNWYTLQINSNKKNWREELHCELLGKACDKMEPIHSKQAESFVCVWGE